jgi:hypothetical protein
MTAPTETPPPPAAVREPWLHSLNPLYRLILRWAYIAILTVLAFHASIWRVVQTTVGGGMGAYVWVVPIAAVLAAIGVARRKRTELPIHDRQTDVIVGTMGLVLALLLHAVLLRRYGMYFDLLRLDLVAMWMFVLSCSIALFGLRPVIRFGWVWVLLFMVFPLPYHLIVILLGGSRVAAGVGTMVIATFASGIVVGRHVSRGVFGSLASWVVGLLVLAVMAVTVPRAPLLCFQMVPALTSFCVIAVSMYLHVRRGAPKRVLDRKLEPLAARQIWAAVPVVLVVAVTLSFVRLPPPTFAPPLQVDDMNNFSESLVPPAGWRVLSARLYPWVQRIYGTDATLIRQKMIANEGDLRFDKFARPRVVVVDTLTTHRPFSLGVYPARMLYHVEAIRFSSLRQIPMAYGVQADAFSAVDDKILVTWDAIQWSWTNGSVAQRVLVFAVDNHQDNALFPEPTGAIGPTLNSLFTVLFRGNSAVSDSQPNLKDQDLLSEFSHALISAQLAPLGLKP